MWKVKSKRGEGNRDIISVNDTENDGNNIKG